MGETDSRAPGSEPGAVSPSVGAIFAAWLDARQPAERGDFERLLAAHPEQAAELVALRADWEVLAGLRASSSLAERLRARHGAAADPRVTLEEEARAPVPELLARLAWRAG